MSQRNLDNVIEGRHRDGINIACSYVLLVRHPHCHALDGLFQSPWNGLPKADVYQRLDGGRIHLIDGRLFLVALLRPPPHVVEYTSIDNWIRTWVSSIAANLDIDGAIVVDGAMTTFDADRNTVTYQRDEPSSMGPFLQNSRMLVHIVSIPSPSSCAGHPRRSRLQFFCECFPQSFRTAIRMLRKRKTSACTFLKRLLTRHSSNIP